MDLINSKFVVEGEGFEPSKAEPSDLQSDPFDRSGTPPAKPRIITKFGPRVKRSLRLAGSHMPLPNRQPPTEANGLDSRRETQPLWQRSESMLVPGDHRNDGRLQGFPLVPCDSTANA
jgi:hypothetical protein